MDSNLSPNSDPQPATQNMPCLIFKLFSRHQRVCTYQQDQAPETVNSLYCPQSVPLNGFKNLQSALSITPGEITVTN